MKKSTTHHLVKVAFMGAIAVALYSFEIPLPGTGLQFDLSDLPVMIAGYMFGFVPALSVALIKNIAHLLFVTRNSGIAGEIANFAFAIMVSLPLVFLKGNSKFKALVLILFTLIFVAVGMSLFNYYVTFPLYGMSKEGAWGIVIGVYTPFNLIKTGLLMALFTLSRPYLDRMMN